VLLALGCCTAQIGGNTFRNTQLACTYASNGCQKDADCPGGFSRCCSRKGVAHRACGVARLGLRKQIAD
jgi:hypothetical protein